MLSTARVEKVYYKSHMGDILIYRGYMNFYAEGVRSGIFVSICV